jgi:hypothetical protein
MEDEDSLVVSFVVGLTDIAKGFLNVLEAAVFPEASNTLKYRTSDWDGGEKIAH